MASAISTFFHNIDPRHASQSTQTLVYLHSSNVTSPETENATYANSDNLPSDQIGNILAVFGAIFFAAVAIILITVFISQLRKRQSQRRHLMDCEAADGPFSKDTQSTETAFPEYKQSTWRKTIRSVILRLRGQEQHKDWYVMPDDLRAQLKRMYVY